MVNNYPGIIVRQRHTHWKHMGLLERASAQSETRYICGAIAVGSGYRMVGGFYGMLLLSAKYSG